MTIARSYANKSFLTASICFLLLPVIYSNALPAGVLYVLLCLVIFLGLPHGAMDIQLAKKYGFATSKPTLFLFVLLYAAIATASFAAWLYSPLACLILFLAISCWHFSCDWQKLLPQPAALSMSGLVLCLPAFFKPGKVAGYFELLMVQPALAELVVYSMLFLGWVFMHIILYQALQAPPSSKLVQVELLMFPIAAAVLPVIAYFVLYFCFLHSIHHMLRFGSLLNKGLVSTFIESIPVLVLTVILLAAATFYLPKLSVDQQLIRLLFIGLFALTVPHMILVDYFVSRQRRAVHNAP